MSAAPDERVETSRPAGLARAELAGRSRRVLQAGRGVHPDVLLVESPGGPVVVKDFSARAAGVRQWLGPWLISREERAYRQLAGVPGVPRLIGRLDAAALVLEYRPGVRVSRSLRGRLPVVFLAELERSVDEMHRRGVVHLDLRHRSNVLAGEDGHPVLIDFASALRFDPTARIGRWLLRALTWIDRRAVEKWRVRLE
jgi:serine/threonine protein kinase